MKEEEWIKRLRDHLADYEAPVPVNLWDKIEARLPKELVAEESKARRIPLWVRLTAAAAFVGVLTGTTVFLWPSHEDTLKAPVASVTKETGKAAQEIRRIAMESQSTKKPEPVIAVSVKAAEPVFAKTGKDERAITEAVVSGAVTSEAVVAEAVVSEDMVSEAATEPEHAVANSQLPALKPADEPTDEQAYKTRRLHSRRTTLSLYASNGFGDLNSKNGVLMSAEMLAHFDYDSRMGVSATRNGDSNPVYLANYEERQQYYQPISFGLTANIPISSAWSLSSGIVYTRLRSDFTNIANILVYQKQTTLHYIGIPLNVQYHVWRWHGLNVYATAGTQVDFNVKARLEADGEEHPMEKDRMQWSVGGALGVQYDIIPLLGLYAEPGIKYYFDNGSGLQNYFKYRPTNFNLQIGLRLNMR